LDQSSHTAVINSLALDPDEVEHALWISLLAGISGYRTYIFIQLKGSGYLFIWYLLGTIIGKLVNAGKVKLQYPLPYITTVLFLGQC
jgi:hypothetical protein